MVSVRRHKTAVSPLMAHGVLPWISLLRTFTPEAYMMYGALVELAAPIQKLGTIAEKKQM